MIFYWCRVCEFSSPHNIDMYLPHGLGFEPLGGDVTAMGRWTHHHVDEAGGTYHWCWTKSWLIFYWCRASKNSSPHYVVMYPPHGPRPPIPSGELAIKNLVRLHTYVERFPAPQWIFPPKVQDSVVEKVHKTALLSQIARKTRRALGFEP